MAASYSSNKSPGRTPPFVLVGLVLLVFILGYNYWIISSSNKSLQDSNVQLTRDMKDTAEKRVGVEKNLESAREEAGVLQGNLDQVKKSLQDRETELNNLRAEMKTIEEERKTCKESIATCDSKLEAETKNVEKLNGEIAAVQSSLKAAQEAKPECSADACVGHVKEAVKVGTKLVGTDVMTKALGENKMDVAKLMEGIERVEAPAPPAPKEPAKEAPTKEAPKDSPPPAKITTQPKAK